MIEKTGMRLKMLRIQQNLTQKQVAQRTGVNSATISAYERGDTSPSGENVRKLASFYQTTTDYILAMDNRETIALKPGLSDAQVTKIRTIVDNAVGLIDESDSELTP